jgi:bifunctional ADP-heptose synthase (sugar kinase/adenylyltransferase)
MYPKLDPLRNSRAIIERQKSRSRERLFRHLHVGHLRYLKGARSLGDVLVVAINAIVRYARL